MLCQGDLKFVIKPQYPYKSSNTMQLLSSFSLLVFFHTLGSLAITLDDFVEDENWEPTIFESNQRILDPDHLRLLDLFNTTDLDDDDFSKDDGSVDCFNLPIGLQKLFRFMFPKKSEATLVDFYLSNRENRHRQKWIQADNVFENGPLDTNRKLVVLVHGFMSNSNMHWVKKMTDAILDQVNANVVAVDWEAESNSWKYWKAVKSTAAVGNEIRRFLKLHEPQGLKMAQVHCIGHSLGSHICSFASKREKLGRITGLDPAAPCFKGKGLSYDKANHVDVIHTDSKLFGRQEALGHQDFFPNRGLMQPGCVIRDIAFLKKFPFTLSKLKEAICSHGRSYEYFIESVRSNDCKFWGHSWNTTLEGALALIKSKCQSESCVPMGLESVRYPGRGIFYLATAEKTPFCIFDGTSDLNMEESKSSMQECAFIDPKDSVCQFKFIDDTKTSPLTQTLTLQKQHWTNKFYKIMSPIFSKLSRGLRKLLSKNNKRYGGVPQTAVKEGSSQYLLQEVLRDAAPFLAKGFEKSLQLIEKVFKLLRNLGLYGLEKDLRNVLNTAGDELYKIVAKKEINEN